MRNSIHLIDSLINHNSLLDFIEFTIFHLVTIQLPNIDYRAYIWKNK